MVDYLVISGAMSVDGPAAPLKHLYQIKLQTLLLINEGDFLFLARWAHKIFPPTEGKFCVETTPFVCGRGILCCFIEKGSLY